MNKAIDDDERVRLLNQPPWLHRAFEAPSTDYDPAIELPRPPRYTLWAPQIAALWWGDACVLRSGRFVAEAMVNAGVAITPRWWLLRHWMERWGVGTQVPACGALAAVRSQGGGYVGFVVDELAGRILVLTWREGWAKQQLVPVEPRDILDYRWPSERETQLQQYLMQWALVDA